MRRSNRHRRSFSPTLDGLESRTRLSSSKASIVFAEFAIPAIKGTIQGTITGITPISANSQLVTYSARGKANIIGDGKGAGQHVITSKVLRDHSSNDTYKNGMATVTGTTDSVVIRYSGTGRTRANGSWTATWNGTAQSVAGEHAGLKGSFSAQISGTSRSGTFTVTLTIKPRL